MSRDTFYLSHPISAQDQEQRCSLDLYGSSPHPPHAWAEVAQQFRHLKEHLRGPVILTGYRCPGRDPDPIFNLSKEDHARVADALAELITERFREATRESLFAPRSRWRPPAAPAANYFVSPTFNPYDLIDPSTIKAYWPEER